jgi:hypothetical protein
MHVPRIRLSRPTQRKRFKIPIGGALILALLFIVVTAEIFQPNGRPSPARAGAKSDAPRAAKTSSGVSQPEEDHLEKLAKEKIAEITAMTRHGDMCAEPPNEWSTAFLVLAMVHTPTEEQVADQERKTLALRAKIGRNAGAGSIWWK